MLRVLLPTDFSDNSFNAISYALSLFDRTPCTFYMLHTFTPAIYRAEYLVESPMQFAIPDTYHAAANAKMEKFKERIDKEFTNEKHKFVTHTAFNTLTDEATEFIENNNIGLVVMGTQGATGAKEIFIGTHTVHLIKKAKVPVLAIPTNFVYEKPKEILFPNDYEVTLKKEHLEILLQIAHKHLSSIEVLNVSYGYDLSEKQQSNKETLDTILESTAHLFHDYSNQELLQAINNFQLKHKTQMLVMVKNKHTFVERLFIEPVIKKIGFHSKIPFLVLPYSN